MKLFNTYSGQLEEFKPLSGEEVKFYACGPTVYDFAHIGNFRTFVFEDLLRRFLEYKGFKVNHVMNVTDVDDKTIAGANKNVVAGSPRPEGAETAPLQRLQNYTKYYLDAFNEDLKTLNILPPTKEPKATSEIKEMLKLISKLIEKKMAYISDGSVYYRVESFKNYGKLSKKDLKQNIKGARVDVDEYEKEEGSDFALWKKAKEGEPGWDSPWGKGRPGWHIECSAMSMKYLGETFDIHAGGEDLIFPHHENEIAQSEGATGKLFVKYWLHAKHLLVNGEKMSKSKGNFYTLRDLLAKGYTRRAIRYALLIAHYREPLNFTLEGLKAAHNVLCDLVQYCSTIINYELFGYKFIKENSLTTQIEELHKSILQALENDLNVPMALAAIFKFMGETDSKIRKAGISQNDRAALLLTLQAIETLFGILPDEEYKNFDEQAKKWQKMREDLRKEKRFNEADQYRENLRSQGYIVWDTGGGASGIARID